MIGLELGLPPWCCNEQNDVFDVARDMLETNVFDGYEQRVCDVFRNARLFNVRTDVLLVLIGGSAWAPAFVIRGESEMIEALRLVAEAEGHNIEVRLV